MRLRASEFDLQADEIALCRCAFPDTQAVERLETRQSCARLGGDIRADLRERNTIEGVRCVEHNLATRDHNSRIGGPDFLVGALHARPPLVKALEWDREEG